MTPTRPGQITVVIGGPAVALTPFLLADGSGPARQPTTAIVSATALALAVDFVCQDADAWGTLSGRDDPLYTEECVEVFLAPGPDDPQAYFEFEISPLGVVFDARITHSSDRRSDLVADVEWNCPGLESHAAIDSAADRWTAGLRIPWAGLNAAAVADATWRVNFFRIDRPRDGSATEFSCWSPTLTDPANFHVPSRFGTLRLADQPSRA